MTTYYITTIGTPILLKNEDECIYKWEGTRWEISGFWWDKIKASDFSEFQIIESSEAKKFIKQYEYA